MDLGATYLITEHKEKEKENTELLEWYTVSHETIGNTTPKPTHCVLLECDLFPEENANASGGTSQSGGSKAKKGSAQVNEKALKFLKALTHQLCFACFRTENSTRLPAPVYYAHLLAERISKYLTQATAEQLY